MVPVANRGNHPRTHGSQNLNRRCREASDKPAKIAIRRVGLGPTIKNGGASPTLPIEDGLRYPMNGISDAVTFIFVPRSMTFNAETRASLFR